MARGPNLFSAVVSVTIKLLDIQEGLLQVYATHRHDGAVVLGAGAVGGRDRCRRPGHELFLVLLLQVPAPEVKV
ncbi:hypothetical protein K1T71_013190 [Dendrolimus kikuchii]|uniref:Uncharacterized protein n=1 Tax=Dendrolimus kikuchii TaxID=765133 RepID=A0ACC1CJD6_9NEOP|nr:hypothetical protein K1T71_013190 [Dendrolimus kikuchii]